MTTTFHPRSTNEDGDWIRGDWMQTYTGRRYFPMDPRPEDIEPEDIAHALSLLCRYGGHIDRFYSVAEHCVNVSHTVAPEHALAALLHDATEAYVVDVPRPVKRYLADYRMVEAKVWIAIASRFGVSPNLHEQVKEHDTRILLDERTELMRNAEVGAWSMDGMEPLGVRIMGYEPAKAERMYLTRLAELWVPS